MFLSIIDYKLFQSLLSLEPPSCMVAPVRDTGNKFFLSSANTNLQQTMALPTVSLPTNMGMDFSFRNISDNYNEVRGRTSSSNPQL